MEGTNTCVTGEHVDFAASLLGTKVLCGSKNQVLIESNQGFLDRFDVHEVNRNVDTAWVNQMKVEMLKTIMAEECMTLTLAIDERLVKAAMEEPEGEAHGGFKAVIIDGQHRWYAMRQIMAELPKTTFRIWLVVYLVSNDTEIRYRLDTINKRRAFTQDDTDKVAVTMRFLDAFDRFVSDPALGSKRCILRVRKSTILKSSKFMDRHRNTTSDEFEQMIAGASASFQAPFYALKGRSVLHDVVAATGLYQLMDASCQWLLNLEK